jgi:uncharacterized RmlC-like cupin family protein
MVTKEDGTLVRYYLFPEYEVHYNEVPPRVTQQWHHHDTVEETLYLIGGSVQLLWRDESGDHSHNLAAGDLARMGDVPHSLANVTSKPAHFVIFKTVADGRDKRAIFGSDKILDQPH